MAQKKRRFQQLEAAGATPQTKQKYNDPIQERVNERLEDIGKKFEGKGKTILYAIIALVVLGAVAYAVTVYSRRSGGEGQTALGKAIETSQAQVSETGPMAGSKEKTFKTEKERAEAAITEFQAVADKFGGAVADKAKYFIAVNNLAIDRAKGIQELEGLASGSSDVAKLSKFALAQTKAEDNKLDEAIALYKELAGMDDAIVAKDTINFELAKVLEKQDKKQEAADLYFNIAKTASEAKDMDGKPVKMSETATNAKDKLKAIDAARADSIVVPTPETPSIGGGAGGLPISVKAQ
ncbi:MAG: hypothetical protein IPL32_16635 [Chloracidobacterium sp.]|nr:hypothetical protein [Chloracidobacterium sp.]